MKNKKSSADFQSKKDKFFITKSNINKHPSRTSEASSSDTGGFFVTSDEKQKILNARQNPKKLNKSFTKKSKCVNSKTQEENIKGDSSDYSVNKKPFDKRKWRLQKYSKKYKLQQWEEKRKKVLLRQYYKQVKHEKPGFDVKDIYEKYDDEENDDNKASTLRSPNEIAAEEVENDNNVNSGLIDEQNDSKNESSNAKQKKKKFLKTAHLKHEKIKEEKQKKREEFLKKKAEREAAVKEYKKQKLEKYKKLSKKTKKGQPIMKYRMEMLLEQIEKSVNN